LFDDFLKYSPFSSKRRKGRARIIPAFKSFVHRLELLVVQFSATIGGHFSPTLPVVTGGFSAIANQFLNNSGANSWRLRRQDCHSCAVSGDT
jgi:hypothetical protein